MKYSHIVTLLIASILILSGFSIGSIIDGVDKANSNNRIKEVNNVELDGDYTSHEPIIINNNTDLDQTAQSEGWSGDGSKGDPYVIEGYDINGTEEGICIYMQYVDRYFTIRNCYLHDASGIDHVGHGTPPNPYLKGNTAIHLWEVSNGIVENNKIRSNDDYGIRLSEDDNISIIDNDISSSYEGVRIRESTNNLIKNNTLHSNSDVGLRFCLNSHNNTVEDNTISNNGDHGLWNDFSDHNMICNNTIESNGKDGVHLSYCDRIRVLNNYISENNDSGINFKSTVNNVLSGNRMINDGLYIMNDFYSHTIDDTNTVNDKPIYYWKNIANTALPDGAGQAILVNCTGVSIEDQNLTDGDIGITIVDSDNLTIKNSKISSNEEYGIYIRDSENNSIYSNNIDSNGRYGIYTIRNNRNTISNNTISNNDEGIYLDNAKNHVIDNNTMKDNGIYIVGEDMKYWETHEITSSNTINGKPIVFWISEENESIKEKVGQVILVNCTDITVNYQVFNGTGIRILECEDIIIENNVIDDGNIDIESSEDVTVRNNVITNGSVGVYLIESKNCRIIDNDLISNEFNLYVRDTKDSIFKKNYVFNGSCGMVFYDDWREYRIFNNVIVRNNISNNKYGLYLIVYRDYPDNNLIYHNNFIDNEDQSRWGGYSGDTQFYNSTLKEGNYWSDYNGTDSNDDGIGDTPYRDIGYDPEDYEDKYPLMEPVDIYRMKVDAGQNRTVEAGDAVNFNGSVSSPDTLISNYTWTIRGKEFYGKNITYTFEEIGNHTVELRVRNRTGAEDTDTVTVNVYDATSPNADAGENITAGMDRSVEFDASGSTDNGKIVNYTWKIKGEQVYGIKVKSTFTDIGVYEVRLNVTDSAGNYDIDMITVKVEDMNEPNADFEVEGELKVGKEITFDASNSVDNARIESYEWDFGDGTSGSGKICYHEYDGKGEYTVKLTVTDESGNTDTYEKTIKIEKKDDDNGIPGFSFMILLISISLSLIYVHTHRSK